MFSTFLVVTKVLFQQIGEKEKLQHKKENEQFDQDDGPQGTSQCHFFKAVNIE